MESSSRIEATVDAAVPFTVGPEPEPENWIRIRVRAPLQQPGDVGFTLRGRLGKGADALFLDEEDAAVCGVAVGEAGPGHQWCPPDWRFTDPDERGRLTAFEVCVRASTPITLRDGEELTLLLTRVISRTEAGRTALELRAGSAGPVPVLVDKHVGRGRILEFTWRSEHPCVLSGDDVRLSWRAHGLRELTLRRAGGGAALSKALPQEGSWVVAGLTAPAEFTLRGFDVHERCVERSLVVEVLRSGWHPVEHVRSESDPEPRPSAPAPSSRPWRREVLTPHLLLGAGDRLYGIFRRSENSHAFLFESRDPHSGWELVRSGDHPPEAVPERSADSPGVFIDGKIWLLGGSQTDPNVRSNDVWRLDPLEGRWEKLPPPGWTARMGHGVVAIPGDLEQAPQIWIMGGLSQGGLLSDVWTFDLAREEWSQLPCAQEKPDEPESPTWAQGCLFATAAFDGAVWLCGGMVEPGARDVDPALHVYDGQKWSSCTLPGLAEGAAPRRLRAAGLLTFRGSLHLLGAFETAGKGAAAIEPLAYRLVTSNDGARSWVALPADELRSWDTEDALGFRLASLGDRMMVARMLRADRPHPRAMAFAPAGPAPHAPDAASDRWRSE